MAKGPLTCPCTNYPQSEQHCASSTGEAVAAEKYQGEGKTTSLVASFSWIGSCLAPFVSSKMDFFNAVLSLCAKYTRVGRGEFFACHNVATGVIAWWSTCQGLWLCGSLVQLQLANVQWPLVSFPFSFSRYSCPLVILFFCLFVKTLIFIIFRASLYSTWTFWPSCLSLQSQSCAPWAWLCKKPQHIKRNVFCVAF